MVSAPQATQDRILHLRNLPSPILFLFHFFFNQPFSKLPKYKRYTFQCSPFSVGIVPFSLPVRVYRSIAVYNAIVTSDPSIGRRTERRLRGVVTLELRFFGERNRAMGILRTLRFTLRWVPIFGDFRSVYYS